MKKFIVSVLPFCFFLSCSSDEVLTDNSTEKLIRPGITLKDIQSPANTRNGYDYVGKLHSQILENYLLNYNETNLFNQVINDVENIAENIPEFNNINNTYTGLSTTELQWTIVNSNLPQNIINKTSMSNYGKNEMLSFINMLDAFENLDYKTAYDGIINFESSIINDNQLNIIDKVTILSTTSTARYSIAYNNPKKRTWVSTKVGIIASINSDVAEAVTTSVAANIMAE